MLPAEFEDPLLLVPGPSQLAPPARRHVGRHVGHRSEMFRRVFRETTELLKRVFDASGDVHILTASGTGAVDAAILNFIKPSDKVLALVFGTFGRRFAEQASRACSKVYRLVVPLGTTPSPAQVRTFVESEGLKEIDVAIMVFNETNPGVTLRELPDIVRYVHDLGGIAVVDNVSGLGGDYFSCDKWDIDVAISSSQKCLASPPGLSFITVRTPEAERRLSSNTCVSTYFDLKLTKKFLEKNETPFTPAVNLLFALRDSLDFIVNNVGLDRWIRWHRDRARLILDVLEKLKLRPFVENSDVRSVTVLSFLYPENVSPAEFRSLVYRLYNIEIADGMDDLRGRIFRIGNMGWVTRRDILALVAALASAVRVLTGDRLGSLDEALELIAKANLLV